MASSLHIMRYNPASLPATGGPPAPQTPAGTASDPGAPPDDRSFTAFTAPETVGSSSSSGPHSTRGSPPTASSLIDDGRLRTPPKRPAHPFKTASLSVRRLVPTALRSGVAPELRGPYTALCIKELFHALSVRKGLAPSALSPSQEPCMPLSLLWTALCMFEQAARQTLSWYLRGKPCVLGASPQGVPEFLRHSHQTNLGACETPVLGNPPPKSERCPRRLSSSHLHPLNCVPVHPNGCRDRWRTPAPRCPAAFVRIYVTPTYVQLRRWVNFSKIAC